MSAKTAQEALEELKQEGFLTDDHLCIKTYATAGDIGRLRIDIENGHNTMMPNGAKEKRYMEIIGNLTREDILTLGELLKKFYNG